MKKIHIIGGGTFSHVRNHLALAAPAFGKTARTLYASIFSKLEDDFLIDYGIAEGPNGPPASEIDKRARESAAEQVVLHLTKMAAPRQSNLVTNEDVSALLDSLIADPDTRVIILNAALCDFNGRVNGADSGPHAERLNSSLYRDHPLPRGLSVHDEQKVNNPIWLRQANKLIGKIRKDRKDIFVVGFKTTTGQTSDDQYRIALDMLKRDSLNLVLANDTVTRNNMIVAPEETRYSETTDRDAVLKMLVQMVLARSSNTFTRSTVVEGDAVPWNSDMIPDNLRAVVNHCIQRGAYKPFRGVTAGHFAVKVNDGRILTSKRKRNFNDLAKEGLVQVDYEGDDKVIAYGAKPSVGGQSQRVVFKEHPELDCIVHFHCPLKDEHTAPIAVASQWQNECGSHQCGQNTSRNLTAYPNSDIKAVMLDGHGPNIVFSRTTPPEKVIEFIEANFDLTAKTGGMVA